MVNIVCTHAGAVFPPCVLPFPWWQLGRWAAANQGVTRPRWRIILLKRDGVLALPLFVSCSLALAPEDVSNKAFAAEDSGLLRLSWPVENAGKRLWVLTSQWWLLSSLVFLPYVYSLALRNLWLLQKTGHAMVGYQRANCPNRYYSTLRLLAQLNSWSSS